MKLIKATKEDMHMLAIGIQLLKDGAIEHFNICERDDGDCVWGIKKVEIFDGDYIVVGYYGGDGLLHFNDNMTSDEIAFEIVLEFKEVFIEPKE